MPEVDAATFRWDQDARRTAALPMPVFSEETLLLHWTGAPPAGGLLRAAIPGIMADIASPYLLATSAAARDGELDPRLLRAPTRSVVRFDRYRHLLRSAAGAIQTLGPSRAGRLLVRGLPHGAAGAPAGASPLLGDTLLVFENVDISSVTECFAALVVADLVHFDAIHALVVFDSDLLEGVSWLFRSWLAYLAVLRAVVRPADPDPSPGLAAALRARFETGQAPAVNHVRAMIDAVRAVPATWAALLAYVQTFFAPLLCGQSWRELGVDFPVPPAMRDAALRRAHKTLEHLPRASGTWLVAFAGCPLGRPALVYAPAAAAGTPRELLSGGVTCFEAEALSHAGRSAAVFPGIALAPSADPFSAPDLAPLAQLARGALAGFRLVDNVLPKKPFTTYDWLAEVTRGANRAVRAAARIDFAPDAAAGHALAAPLHWDLFQEARQVRDWLDTLDATRIGPVPLAEAILQWWVDRTGIADGAGRWPVQRVGRPPEDLPPAPRDSFRDGATRAIGGFDEFDILAAVNARRELRDAKELAASIPLPVILALLDVEGYRSYTRQEREGGRFFSARQVPDGAGGVRPARRADYAALDGPRFQDTFARTQWVVFPYGLDIFNQRVSTASAGAFAATEPTSFRRHIDDDFITRALLPGSYSSQNAHRFVVARLEGRFHGPTLEIQNRRLSRRLQTEGILLQQAEFQVRHFLLYHADAPGSDHEQVAELLDPLRPLPGANANSVERRDWIAYWALVYLAFNVSAPTFNEWIRASAGRPAGTRVSNFLLYRRNVANRAVEPVPPPVGRRTIYQRTNMIRFAVALDAYARILPAGAPDASDPAGRIAW